MEHPRQWAKSKTLDQLTEIAILSPVRLGRVPGERRTFEERLRFKISDLQRRAEQGLPNELNRITTIHIGRMSIIRPEQYLVYSGLDGFPAPEENQEKVQNHSDFPFDEYTEISDSNSDDPPTQARYRSWLLTQVVFDGDIKVYFREIAQFIANQFDAVFENCEDFPGTGNFEGFWTWIRRYQINNDLFLCAHPNLSVPRIKQLEEFKNRFDEFVSKVRSPEKPSRSIDQLFDEFLKENQQHASGFPAPGGVYQTNNAYGDK